MTARHLPARFLLEPLTRFDLSDALILSGTVAAIGALGWLFGPPISVLTAGVVLIGFGFAVHLAGRR